MEDKTLTMTMLFDFFGDLLTEKQREYFDLHYNEDLSLAEIAESAGISRQGVRDHIVRAEATLLAAEQKTGIVRRFSAVHAAAQAISEDVRQIRAHTQDAQIRALTEDILRQLEELEV